MFFAARLEPLWVCKMRLPSLSHSQQLGAKAKAAVASLLTFSGSPGMASGQARWQLPVSTTAAASVLFACVQTTLFLLGGEF